MRPRLLFLLPASFLAVSHGAHGAAYTAVDGYLDILKEGPEYSALTGSWYLLDLEPLNADGTPSAFALVASNPTGQCNAIGTTGNNKSTVSYTASLDSGDWNIGLSVQNFFLQPGYHLPPSFPFAVNYS